MSDMLKHLLGLVPVSAPTTPAPTVLETLFARFIRLTRDVAPSDLDATGAVAEVLGAPTDARLAFLEEYLVTFFDRQASESIFGRYGMMAILNVLYPLLRDQELPFSAEYVRKRLIPCAPVLPELAVAAALEKVLRRYPDDEALRIAVLDSPHLEALRPLVFDPLPRTGTPLGDRVRADLAACSDGQRKAWREVFDHIAQTRCELPPHGSWMARARTLIRALPSRWPVTIASWLQLVATPATIGPSDRPSQMTRREEHEATILHGLVAMLGLDSLDASGATALVHVSGAAFGRVGERGRWLPSLGYRCLDQLQNAPEHLTRAAAAADSARARRYIARIAAPRQ